MQLSYGSMALLAESGACHQLIDAVSDVGKAEHVDLIDLRLCHVRLEIVHVILSFSTKKGR